MRKNSPLISVIVPTYNRPVQLSECLEALTNQDFGRDRFEVIVIDDGSRISVAPVVVRFEKSLHVISYRQANAGPAAARNSGAMKANAKYLAFMDDDCQPAADWLRLLYLKLKGDVYGIVGGTTINGVPKNFYSTASQWIVSSVYAYYNHNKSRARFFATNNMAVAANTFFLLGRFDPSFRTSEDRDFCDRAIMSGIQMLCEPNAHVRHFHRLTFASYFQIHFDYGKGAYRFYRAHEDRCAADSTIEIAFYISTLQRMRKWLRRFRTRPAILFSLLIVLWQVANFAGFISEWAFEVFKGKKKNS